MKLRPVSTKPFFLAYVKRETDVRKTNWLSGHGLFANRPAGTVRSLPPSKSAQWTRAFKVLAGGVYTSGLTLI